MASLCNPRKGVSLMNGSGIGLAKPCFLLLASIVGMSSAHAASWQSHTQVSAPNAELCGALLKRLNSFSERCVADAVETYPAFSEPPWDTLDPSSHVDLIGKLVAYRSGANAFFRQQIDPSRLHTAGQYFVDHGGLIQVWRTRLLSNFGDSAEHPARPGEQTVIMLTTKVGAADPLADCPGKVTKNWDRSVFIVLPDLSGPDPRVGNGTASV